MNKRKSKNSILSKIINLVIWVILIYALYKSYQFYQTNNFGEFVRSEAILNTSEFSRDSEIKYSKTKSYKITSNIYNDAMFYKEVDVKKNTPYKVTCMVKTNNVKSEKALSGSGAQISIADTTERSVAITGTQEWQKIELIFIIMLVMSMRNLLVVILRW